MVILTVLFLVLLFIHVRYNFFTPARSGLRVLMYHKLSERFEDNLTISQHHFESQIRYLLDHDYTFYSMSELIEAHKSTCPLPAKAVTITFDDAYVNNLTYLLPVLKKYNLKACIFIPVSFIGKSNTWDEGNDSIMNPDQLKQGIPYFEFGLHSYSHQNISQLTGIEFQKDLELSMSFLSESEIPFLKVLAYPYGQFPKNNDRLKEVNKIMNKIGIVFGFRIGNKTNPWPVKKPFLLKRIDIKGTDTLWDFKTKIKKGRTKIF